MKTPLVSSGHAHATPAAQRSAAPGTTASQATTQRSGFAQMLFDGLGDDPTALGPIAEESTGLLPERDAMTAADLPSDASQDSPAPVPQTGDPLSTVSNPSQAMMALLGQVSPPAPSGDPHQDSTASLHGKERSTRLTPSGVALPVSAQAKGLDPDAQNPGQPSDATLDPSANGLSVPGPEQGSSRPLADTLVPRHALSHPQDGTASQKAPQNPEPIERQETAAISNEAAKVLQRPADTPASDLSPVAGGRDTSPITRTAPGKRVSVAAKDASVSGPPPQSLGSLAGLESSVSWHMSTPGQPGSALPQAETPGVAHADALANAAAAHATASHDMAHDPGDRKEHEGAPGTPTPLNQDASAASTGGAPDSRGSPSPFATSLGQAMGDAFETLGAQVSFWASQNTKHARLNLDAGLDDPLAVDVSLNNGQVTLAFHTDDPAAQAALKTHAETVLSDLLSRSGIGLAGLSVGSQGQFGQFGQGQGSEPPPRPPQGLNRHLEQMAPVPASAAPVTTVRGRRGLDVYA